MVPSYGPLVRNEETRDELSEEIDASHTIEGVAYDNWVEGTQTQCPRDYSACASRANSDVSFGRVSSGSSATFTRTHSALRRACRVSSLDSGESVLDDAEIDRCESFAIPSASVTLGALIGKGACGDVCIGSWNNMQVAIKMTQRVNSNSSQEMTDMLKEISLMSSNLKHPNIVGFYGICIDGALPWMVIEYMGGGSVDQYYHSQRQTEGWVPQRKKALQWSLDVAAAVDYLHSRTPVILHRDIKPGNLMLTDDLTHLKLCDFGVSTKLKEGRSPEAAMASELLRDDNGSEFSGESVCEKEMSGRTGTYRYMAPEVFEQLSPYDRSIDMYSAAVSIWFLLFGEEPYSKMDGFSVAQLAARQGLRPVLNKKEKKVPAAVTALLERMWDAKPSNRPNSSEVLATFEAAYKKERSTSKFKSSLSSGMAALTTSFNLPKFGRSSSTMSCATDDSDSTAPP